MKTRFFLLAVLSMFFAATTSFAQRVAVLEFNAGAGISQADVEGISAIFNTYFTPAGYTLVERTQIDRVIDEQNFQRGSITQSQMVRIGQILNVSKVVIGDVNYVMNQYNVDVRVVNVESGTIAAMDGVTWTPGSSYRTMMSELAAQLASKIAIKSTSTSTYNQQSGGYEIGDYYDVGGKQGVVFAVTPDGQHGKIVCLQDLGRADWYDAKSICANLGSGWRLPTEAELSAIYGVKNELNSMLIALGDTLGGLGAFHWSSTAVDADRAWFVNIGNGEPKTYNKSQDFSVRAVSAF